MAEEDLQRPAVPLATAARVMFGFAWRADRRLSVLVLACRLAGAAATALFALWLGLLANAVAARDGAAAVVLAAAVAVSVVGGSLLDFGATRLTRTLSERAHHLVQRRLMQLVGGTPTLEIHETPAHLTQLERLQEASWEFGEVVPSLINLLETAVRLAITLVLLATVDPWLLLLPLFGIPILLFGPKASQSWFTAQQKAAEPLRRMNAFLELATSVVPAKEIRLYRLRETVRRRFAAAAEQSRSIQTRYIAAGQAIRAGTRAFFAVGYLGAIVLVTRHVVDRGAPIGELLTTAVLGGQVLALVAGSSALAVWTSQTLIAASRFVYLDRLGRALRAGVDATAEVPQRLRTGIRIEHIEFAYPGRAEPTLRDVDLLLPAGSTVAVVGDNGAGKSTLIKLLAGLYPPSRGRILVDGLDLARIDPDRWRLRTSAGFQDHARFELLAGQTVGIGSLPVLDQPGVALAAVQRAAAGDVLSALPQGLATQLGTSWDGGVDLSGGQWQKLAIARAMMRSEPLLLLLDEPTAAIDAESEHRLFESWTQAARELRERSGAITVLVSHRFSTVRMADLIVVLDGGRVVEVGSHAQLMRTGGLYAELFAIQARAYRS